MGNSIMIFLLGGCAGWAIHSIVASYKRRKLMNDISTMAAKLSEVLAGASSEESEESTDDDIPEEGSRVISTKWDVDK